MPPERISRHAMPVATSVTVAVTPRAKIFWMSLVHQSIATTGPPAGVAVLSPVFSQRGASPA